MKALLGDTVIAEAPQEDLIKIEGNWYFPPSSVNSELLVESATPYTCPWKVECQYFSVKDGDTCSRTARGATPPRTRPRSTASARTSPTTSPSGRKSRSSSNSAG